MIILFPLPYIRKYGKCFCLDDSINLQKWKNMLLFFPSDFQGIVRWDSADDLCLYGSISVRQPLSSGLGVISFSSSQQPREDHE